MFKFRSLIFPASNQWKCNVVNWGKNYNQKKGIKFVNEIKLFSPKRNLLSANVPATRNAVTRVTPQHAFRQASLPSWIDNWTREISNLLFYDSWKTRNDFFLLPWIENLCCHSYQLAVEWRCLHNISVGNSIGMRPTTKEIVIILSAEYRQKFRISCWENGRKIPRKS